MTHSLPEAMLEIAKKVRSLCNGHPAAKIAWPHRDLHEIADQIEALASAPSDEIERLRKALEPFVRVGNPILSEAPINCTEYAVFTDCEGQRHDISLDEFRQADAALSALPPSHPTERQ